MNNILFLKDSRTILLFVVGGALAGYLILHPYAMLVFLFTDAAYDRMGWKNVLASALQHFTMPMAVPFVFFGGLIGLLSGMVVHRQKMLRAAEFEIEKKKIAMETMQKLMITLSHHLLNANAVIGGMAHRCKKKSAQEEREEYLDIIEKEARRIDTVVRALRKITEIKTADYTSEGHGLLIDISKEIEELLGKTEKKEDEH